MKLVIGLGNPGKKYENNRHNVGHMFIDYLINNLQNANDRLKLVKTDCFMNQSGAFVKRIARSSSLDNLIVIHDDLDIPLGKFHIQKGVGPKLHNGLESIEQNLKSKDFWRIRIGVDARTPERWVDGEAYVLHNFLPEEKKLLIETIFPKISDQFNQFLKDLLATRSL